MIENFDMVIIGSGSAASTAAFEAAREKLKVAVIDQKPIGGTCALRGCDPKKILFGATESLESVRRLQRKGILQTSAKMNWPSLIDFKSEFTGEMSHRIESSLRGSGIKVIRGRAAFVTTDTVAVGDRKLKSSRILIATGMKPSKLSFPGSEYVIDNEAFLDLRILPERLLFIGGGYISVEFASIAGKAGSKSTIVQRRERILMNFDADAVEELTRSLEHLGVAIMTNTTVKSIEKHNGEFEVTLESGGHTENVVVDSVVHGAGREFDSGLNPEVAGIKWTRRGVTVNEFLQSVSNPAVYAAGDAADTRAPKLTPVAVMEGRAAITNMLKGNSVRPDYSAIPTCVFSSPPLAMVGISDSEDLEKRGDIMVRKGKMSSWYNSRRRMIENAYYKVITDRKDGKILGAHIMGENAEETINIFSLAMRLGLTSEDLSSAPFIYPSDIYDIRYMLG